MTPRERVEAVARIAWGVPHVRVEVFPDSRHPARIVASALVYTHDVGGIPMGWPCFTAWDHAEDAALTRLAQMIVDDVRRAAAEARVRADASSAAANAAESLLVSLAPVAP